MTKRERELTEQVERLTMMVNDLLQKLEAANTRIAEQDAEIAKLKEQLNRNSQNSSKPPSTDGYKKPNRSLRSPSGKKPGGQDGHKGHNLKAKIEPTEIVQHMPYACTGCPSFDVCKGRACAAESRQVVDTVVKVSVVEHQAMEIVCPLSRVIVRGDFPSDVKAPIQYGENLTSLVVAFNTIGAVSISRIHEIFGGVFCIPLSMGTIVNMVHRCAEVLAPSHDKLRRVVTNLDVGHFDETGTRVDKHTKWVHVASNNQFTYLYLNDKRGRTAMDEQSVLPDFHGIAVHDCFASYWVYGSAHGLCCAHLLRELNGIVENYPEQTWATKFKVLLLDMKAAKEDAIASNKKRLDAKTLNRLSRRYGQILRHAYRQNPEVHTVKGQRGRKKRGRVLALIDRLKKHKASVCLFAENFRSCHEIKFSF